MSAEPKPNWSELMASAQSGDGAAYACLLAEVLPWLRALARHALRDETEDAVQDILLTLHAARHTYDPDRPFKPWLAAIARARIADRQRGQVRRFRRETMLDQTHETFAAEPANMFMDAEALAHAVAGLPAGQRQALELLKLKEMTLQEAAAQTGLTITALKVATHRAIAALRRKLAP